MFEIPQYARRLPRRKTGAVWAQKDDPRRTWFGSFIRRVSIDELPQLFNVPDGRHEPGRSASGAAGVHPEVQGKPFRTTWLAMRSRAGNHRLGSGSRAWRGNTSLRKRVQYDLYYIVHWTPWLDLRILWMTIFKGIIHKNAY